MASDGLAEQSARTFLDPPVPPPKSPPPILHPTPLAGVAEQSAMTAPVPLAIMDAEQSATMRTGHLPKSMALVPPPYPAAPPPSPIAPPPDAPKSQPPPFVGERVQIKSVAHSICKLESPRKTVFKINKQDFTERFDMPWQFDIFLQQ